VIKIESSESSFDNFKLFTTVFISGAVVMVYELLGSRIVSPYLGTSMYAWSSLIGVILLSLSIGYWLGGRLADENPSYNFFARIILIAAALVALTLIIETSVLTWIQAVLNAKFLKLSYATFLANLLLFAPASIFLGMITPYAVKLKLHSLSKVGKTIGNLYAVSTVGSIVGTFSAGFLLIPFFGTTMLLGIIDLLLLFLAIFIFPKNLKRIGFLALFLLTVISLTLFFSLKVGNTDNVKDIDTRYGRFWIKDAPEFGTGRIVRLLLTSPFASQTGMYLDNPDELVSKYLQFFTLFSHFNPQAKEVLMIGGGGFNYPKYHAKNFPAINLDIVEIDPKLTEIAENYFNFKLASNHKILNEDGRTFVNTTQKKYDVLLLDAFTSIYSIPYSLTTKEAVQKYYDLLNPEGVVIVNIISGISGEKAMFLRAEYKTYQEIFDQVYLFSINKQKETEVQNLVIVGIKSKQKPVFKSDLAYGFYLDNLVTSEINTDLPVLTDDYAPVDFYIEKLLE
jgi:spermidine synthase